MRIAFLLPAFNCAVLFCAADSYYAEIERWRTDRQAKLQTDDGWLTVSGLVWLKEGPNPFRIDPKEGFVLDEQRSAMGTLRRRGREVSLEAPAGTPLRRQGAATVNGPLRTDKAEHPDLITYRNVSLSIIERGDRIGVRVRDKDSSFRRSFTTLKWYPIDPAYRLVGNFQPYPTPRKVKVDTIIGEPEEMTAPGVVTFSLHGRTLSLEPVLDEGQLWFIFRDTTSNRQTYGGGRFLYADLPRGGKVVVDFNKAYNPPCVFTPFATCPLPLARNRLPVSVEAGEQMYGEHHPPAAKR